MTINNSPHWAAAQSDRLAVQHAKVRGTYLLKDKHPHGNHHPPKVIAPKQIQPAALRHQPVLLDRLIKRLDLVRRHARVDLSFRSDLVQRPESLFVPALTHEPSGGFRGKGETDSDEHRGNEHDADRDEVADGADLGLVSAGHQGAPEVSQRGLCVSDEQSRGIEYVQGRTSMMSDPEMKPRRELGAISDSKAGTAFSTKPTPR